MIRVTHHDWEDGISSGTVKRHADCTDVLGTVFSARFYAVPDAKRAVSGSSKKRQK